MRKFFATDDYRREGRLPKVWLSAVGAPYHYECSTIPAKDPDGSDGPKRSQRRKWCGDREESDVLLLGMPRQRNAAGFLVRRAVEHDQITRLYYFNFQSVRGIPGAHARKCKKPVSDPRIRRCNEDEFGLIGADDDKAYQQRAAAQPDDEVIAVGDGPADYSGPGDRRLVFCLLRDHHPVKISGPERRVRSCGPAD